MTKKKAAVPKRAKATKAPGRKAGRPSLYTEGVGGENLSAHRHTRTPAATPVAAANEEPTMGKCMTKIAKTRKTGRPKARGSAPMPMLSNARHERFAQSLAKGMSATEAYTKAGYKSTGHAAEANGARLMRNDKVKARVAELQGSTAKQITDVRDLARRHTREALETLVSVMRDEIAPASARVAAANALLDRGYGKAPQTIEANVTVLDDMTLPEKEALLAALDIIAESEADADLEADLEPAAKPH